MADGVIRLPNRIVDGATFRESSVSSSVARKDPYACPACGSHTVLVEGQFRREFAEEFFEGQTDGYDLAGEMEKNILAIICPTCKMRYVIEQDLVFALRQEILDLKMALAKVNGLNTVAMESSRVN